MLVASNPDKATSVRDDTAAGYGTSQQGADDHYAPPGTSSADGDSAEDILDWMGALLSMADRSNNAVSVDELLLLYRSGTQTLVQSRRSATRVRRRVKPLLMEAIAADLTVGARSVLAPSGLDVPEDWWNDYLRLDEFGNDSLLLFMLDEVLDPPPGEQSPW